MFFEQNNLNIQLLGVLQFDEAEVAMRTAPRSFCALSLRIEGDTDIEFQNRRIHLSSHDLTFFPPYLGYLRRARRDNMIVFHFSAPAEFGHEPEVLSEFAYDALLPLFTKALEEWNQRLPGYEYRTTALFYQVLAEIASRIDTPAREAGMLVSTATDYLRQHYTDPEVNIALLAQECHVSESYLRRIFRKELGMPPKQYLNALRFERAKALLNAGYDTVASVAEKSGFPDEKNFSTAFKKKFGYSPSKQRYGM